MRTRCTRSTAPARCGWSTHEQALFAIDPATNKVVGRVDLGGEPMQVIAVDNHMWVSIGDTGELVQVSVP